MVNFKEADRYPIKTPFHKTYQKLREVNIWGEYELYRILGSFALKMELKPIDNSEYEGMDDLVDKVVNPKFEQKRIFEIRSSSYDKNSSIPLVLKTYHDKEILEKDSAPYKLFSRLVHASLRYIEDKDLNHADIISTIVK